MPRSKLRAGAAGLAASLALSCADAAPEGPRLYVTSGFTDEVLVLDPGTGELTGTVPVDRRPGERDEPHGVAVSPSGEHWYATLSHGEPSLWKFETHTDRLVGRLTLPMNGASRVSLHPDGSRAVVSDYWLGGLGQPSEIVVVGLHDLEVLAERTVCPAPHHAEWSPGGRVIAVTCALSDEVVLLDGDSYEVLNRFPVALRRDDGLPATPGNPIAMPMNLAWSPDGSTLYVTLMRMNQVAAFGVDGQALWAVAVGQAPAQITISPDGSRLAVAHRGPTSAGVAWLDASTGEGVFHTIADVLHPHGVVLSPDGGTLYLTYEGGTRSQGGVIAMDPASGERLWHTPAGVFTIGLALLP